MIMDTRFLVASSLLLVHMYSSTLAVGNASVRCMERERRSLLSLKKHLVDRHGNLSSWGEGENQKECCNWKGVSCDEQTGHVDTLHLGNLEGKITSSLAELHHLKELVLSGFNLTQFPSIIISLKRLECLDLSSANLKGRIPYQLGDLFRLRTLSLSGNQLEGGIPKSLALCTLRELYLGNNTLSGQLDEFIASFSHCANKSLQVLDLSNNRFSGPLPNFSKLMSLQSLFLHDNKLNGTLDDSIGLLSNLQGLYIQHNSLQGVISETHFSKLSQLEGLDFSFNNFSFQISPDWNPPFQLYFLRLASCKLGPSFPIWLQTQKSSCAYLDISSAKISGTIPSWFWDFSFQSLNLSHNQISGEIPNIQFQSAEYMDFSSNLFEGSIPSTLSNSTTLDLSNNKFTDASSLLCPNTTAEVHVLDLSNNKLSGMLPNCWMYFEFLVVLNVANNSLFGKLPTSVGSLRKIRALHLGFNRFTGEMPLVLNECTELTTFDLVQNNFSGSIPSWIGNRLKKLRILILRSNMFSGSLPSSICHLSQVQILDLSMNNISGSLPKCFSHLSALANQTKFDAAISYQSLFSSYFVKDIALLVWKGREHKYQSILGLVKSIDFSSNMLIGEIPSEIMNLVGLVSLNISRNMITGQIPITIGQLKSLEVLDLSRNNLFGNIPPELSQLDFLDVMDLSHNNLSGKIPISTQLQSFDPSTFVGNAKLCGDPLPKCPSKPIEDNQNDGNSEEDKQFFNQGFFISMSIGFSIGFGGVCSLIFVNKSWNYAYFNLLDDMYSKIYVAVALNMAKLRRWNRGST